MMKSELNIAVFQQNIIWEKPEANRLLVAGQLHQLSQPVDMLVLPETFSTGFSDNMAAMAEPPEGPTLRFAQEMAHKYNLLFVATWTVRDGNGTVFNRLHWVRPDGTYGFYDKAHTFRMSSEAAQLGKGTSCATFEWQGWRVRPAICYDLRFPKWLRNKTIDSNALDYDLLIFCANWPASRALAWQTLLKARAIENLSYVVGVNRVGTDGVGIPYSGCSMAIDFKGVPLVECQPACQQLKTVSLSAAQLAEFRAHWPFYLDFD